MPQKTIFLVGAPTSRSLCWDEAELLDSPVPPFCTPEEDDRNQRKPSILSTPFQAKWRILQDRMEWEESPDQAAGSRKETTLFFTTKDLVGSDSPLARSTQKSEGSDESDLSHFYDHSISIHESFAIETSGLLQGGISRESVSVAENDGTPLGGSGDESTPSPNVPPSIQGPISDVEEIPNAQYLRSIIPQTMTMNLVVGILAVHPPRRVVTRQWRRELTIVELVVGDETRSGFGITFWLPPAYDSDRLGHKLSKLRPQDIILLRTVALSLFGERVYGQSLSKGMTKVDLLHRGPVDSTDTHGIYSMTAIRKNSGNAASSIKDDLLLAKVCKVREWILHFVGYPTDKVKVHAAACADQILPPDTPDTQ